MLKKESLLMRTSLWQEVTPPSAHSEISPKAVGHKTKTGGRFLFAKLRIDYIVCQEVNGNLFINKNRLWP